jgi:hypothetical protein
MLARHRAAGLRAGMYLALADRVAAGPAEPAGAWAPWSAHPYPVPRCRAAQARTAAVAAGQAAAGRLPGAVPWSVARPGAFRAAGLAEPGADHRAGPGAHAVRLTGCVRSALARSRVRSRRSHPTGQSGVATPGSRWRLRFRAADPGCGTAAWDGGPMGARTAGSAARTRDRALARGPSRHRIGRCASQCRHRSARCRSPVRHPTRVPLARTPSPHRHPGPARRNPRTGQARARAWSSVSSSRPGCPGRA